MNCRRRKAAKPERAAVERKEGKPQRWNELFQGGDKHGMEYRPIPRTPGDKDGRIVEWK